MEIGRDNSRAVLVNGAIRTRGVHSAVRPMNIDLLRAIKFYYIPGTMRRVSVRCVPTDLTGIKIDLI
jgi:hypothetical protein